MDNRVLTISSGYVNVTEVMPAQAPHSNRRSASNGSPAFFSKYWQSSVVLSEAQAIPSEYTYGFVEIECAKLHSRIRHYTYAVGAIACHEALHALFFPHLGQRLPYRHLVCFSARALHLKEDLQSFQRRYHSPRHGARESTGDEGGYDGLRNSHPQVQHSR